METATRRRAPIGAVLLLIGGALGAIGSFLTWADVRVADVSASAKGVDGSDGYITIVAGLIAIVAGIAALRAPKRAIAVLGIVAGLVLMGVGIYDAATAEDNVLDSVAEEIAPTLGTPVEQVRDILQQQADSGQLDISIAIGLYAVIAGGALALIGGVIAAVAPKRAEVASPMPATDGPPRTAAATGEAAWPASPPSTTGPPSASPPPPPPGTSSE